MRFSYLIFAMLLFLPGRAAADEQLRVGNLLVELRSTEDGFELLVSADQIPAGVNAKASFLHSPSRLVLDVTPSILSGAQASLSKSSYRFR